MAGLTRGCRGINASRVSATEESPKEERSLPDHASNAAVVDALPYNPCVRSSNGPVPPHGSLSDQGGIQPETTGSTRSSQGRNPTPSLHAEFHDGRRRMKLRN